MKDGTRAVIAAIGAAAIQKRQYSSVYDYSKKKFISISAKVSNNNVEAYDYDNSCHVGGNLPGGIYHYGDSAFIELNIRGAGFDGYDYHTFTFYEGTVRGKDVEIYDYGKSKFYNYEVG